MLIFIIVLIINYLLFDSLWRIVEVEYVGYFVIFSLFLIKSQFIYRLLTAKNNKKPKINLQLILKKFGTTRKRIFIFFFIIIVNSLIFTLFETIVYSTLISSVYSLVYYILFSQKTYEKTALLFSIFGGLSIFGGIMTILRTYLLERKAQVLDKNIERSISLLKSEVEKSLSRSKLVKFLDWKKENGELKESQYKYLIKHLSIGKYLEEWEKYHKEQTKIFDKTWGKVIRNILRPMKEKVIRIEILPASKDDIEKNMEEDFIANNLELYMEFSNTIYNELECIIVNKDTKNIRFLDSEEIEDLKSLDKYIDELLSEFSLLPLTLEQIIPAKYQLLELSRIKEKKIEKKKDFVDLISLKLFEKILAKWIFEKL